MTHEQAKQVIGLLWAILIVVLIVALTLLLGPA
jgi:hypothetical protein